MAAVDLSSVLADVKKAIKAETGGPFARAAERFEAAVAAARALGTPPDCLVVAYLTVRQAYAAYLLSSQDGMRPGDALLLQGTVLALLDATAPVLHSRRAAGTLTGAERRPVEVPMRWLTPSSSSRLHGTPP